MPRFSLRTLFAATAAVGALLASIAVENDIATVVNALLIATVLPPALMTAAIRSRGYLRSFCLGALIPAGLMCWFVADQAAKHMGPVNSGAVGNSAVTATVYFRSFCTTFAYRVRYVTFAFGLASLLAGLTAAATHWLLADAGSAQAPPDETD